MLFRQLLSIALMLLDQARHLKLPTWSELEGLDMPRVKSILPEMCIDV
jgi:hypothetical protein